MSTHITESDDGALVTLRCATAGSVDDGKSTLIGRLLYDADALFQDQISHVVETSKRRGQRGTDLSLYTDGLRAEREQGITIDVAWRYAKTKKRRFILGDAPGHVQYTRNTLTAASTADVIVILVDATKAVNDLLPQTKRHLTAAIFLGVPQIAIAVNKMDEVGFEKDRFVRIRELVTAYVASHALAKRRTATTLEFFPVSALDGDNVVRPSDRTPWFDGTTLLAYLSGAPRIADPNFKARFSVQWVRRADAIANAARGYSGRLSSGSLRVGDEVRVISNGARTRIASITSLDGETNEASGPRSLTLTLADEIDLSRGDVIVLAEDASGPTREVTLDVAWVGHEPLRPGASLLLKHGARKVRATVDRILHGCDVENGSDAPAEALGLNDFGRVHVRTSEPLLWDPYRDLRETGRAILIGRESADTVAAAIFSGD